MTIHQRVMTRNTCQVRPPRLNLSVVAMRDLRPSTWPNPRRRKPNDPIVLQCGRNIRRLDAGAPRPPARAGVQAARTPPTPPPNTTPPPPIQQPVHPRHLAGAQEPPKLAFVAPSCATRSCRRSCQMMSLP